MVIRMIEILKVTHYDWRGPDGKVRPKTQVTWRDEAGQVHITVLKGTLWETPVIEREVMKIWRRRR